MSDRELLELAAKAAGIDAPYDDKWSGMLIPFTVHEPDDGSEYWNPLTSDGDAFRLAAALGMNVRFWDVEVAVDRNGDPWIDEPIHDGDKCAATRRAIVRAAAEIGKKP